MVILSLKWILSINHQKHHNTKWSNISFWWINLSLKNLWRHEVWTANSRFKLWIFYCLFYLINFVNKQQLNELNTSFENPKSVNFAVPLSNKIFAGFRSRCTTPFFNNSLYPAKICFIILIVSLSDKTVP